MEFSSEQFGTLCRNKWISRHKIVRRNPQQNGVVERMNRTILERVRCILLTAGLPKSFLDETIFTACYLINRCSSSFVSFKTHISYGVENQQITQTLNFLGA